MEPEPLARGRCRRAPARSSTAPVLVVPALPRRGRAAARRRGPRRSPAARASTAHAVARVGRDLADARGREPREERRLLRARGAPGRRRRASREEFSRQPVAPRGDERREGRERAARSSGCRRPRPGGRRGRANQRTTFDSICARPGAAAKTPTYRLTASATRSATAACGQPAARDVGEVAGPGRVEALRDDAFEEKVEQLLGGRPASGIGSTSERASAAPPSRPCDGCAGSEATCATMRARGGVDQLAQGVRGELEAAVFGRHAVSRGARPGLRAGTRGGIHGGSGMSRRVDSATTLGSYISRSSASLRVGAPASAARGMLRVRELLPQPGEDSAAAAGPDRAAAAAVEDAAPCRPRRGAPSRTSGAPGAGTPCPRRRASARRCRARRHRGDPRLVVVLRAVEGEHREGDVALEQLRRPALPVAQQLDEGVARRRRRRDAAGSRRPSAASRRARRAARSRPRAARRPATARADIR